MIRSIGPQRRRLESSLRSPLGSRLNYTLDCCSGPTHRMDWIRSVFMPHLIHLLTKAPKFSGVATALSLRSRWLG